MTINVHTGTYHDVTTTDCNVVSKGKADVGESHYGGDNNADNSGVLKYVVVKHTGAGNIRPMSSTVSPSMLWVAVH